MKKKLSPSKQFKLKEYLSDNVYRIFTIRPGMIVKIATLSSRREIEPMHILDRFMQCDGSGASEDIKQLLTLRLNTLQKLAAV